MLVRNETLEADRKYEGYVKSGVAYADGSAVEGTEIANGATIIVSYEVDEEQTKDLSYTVPVSYTHLHSSNHMKAI